MTQPFDTKPVERPDPSNYLRKREGSPGGLKPDPAARKARSPAAGSSLTPAAQGSPKARSAATGPAAVSAHFRRMYERGDLPIRVDQNRPGHNDIRCVPARWWRIPRRFWQALPAAAMRQQHCDGRPQQQQPDVPFCTELCCPALCCSILSCCSRTLSACPPTAPPAGGPLTWRPSTCTTTCQCLLTACRRHRCAGCHPGCEQGVAGFCRCSAASATMHAPCPLASRTAAWHVPPTVHSLHAFLLVCPPHCSACTAHLPHLTLPAGALPHAGAARL